MTATSISLLSIILGIIGGNVSGKLYPKFSFGFIGNTIAGVFGSIFIIKLFGRLGFNPQSIMASGEVDVYLLSINLLISFLSGGLAIIIATKLKAKMNSKKDQDI